MSIKRRDFIKGMAGVGAGLILPMHTVLGANDRVNVAVAGVRNRGKTHIKALAALPNVNVIALCDPDAEVLEEQGAKLPGAVLHQDYRKLLEMKELDAISIVTPNHWHAPMAIHACQAGKHVYVEKPCSHNVREGRLLVDAARRNNCVVQHGTQVRSTPMMIEAVELLRSGIIGDVLISKAWNIQRRGSIGHGKPTDPPKGFDYDTWVGPATMIPYQANRVHGG